MPFIFGHIFLLKTNKSFKLNIEGFFFQNGTHVYAYRRQIDIMTYQLLFFLSDTLLCLFGDDMIDAHSLVAFYQGLELSFVYDALTCFDKD